MQKQIQGTVRWIDSHDIEAIGGVKKCHVIGITTRTGYSLEQSIFEVDDDMAMSINARLNAGEANRIPVKITLEIAG